MNTSTEPCPRCHDLPIVLSAPNHLKARAALDAIITFADSLPGEAARSQEYFDLGGPFDETDRTPYEQYLLDIRAAVYVLRQAAKAIAALKGHQHRWTSDDYCAICGADGRA